MLGHPKWKIRTWKGDGDTYVRGTTTRRTTWTLTAAVHLGLNISDLRELRLKLVRTAERNIVPPTLDDCLRLYHDVLSWRRKFVSSTAHFPIVWHHYNIHVTLTNYGRWNSPQWNPNGLKNSRFPVRKPMLKEWWVKIGWVLPFLLVERVYCVNVAILDGCQG